MANKKVFEIEINGVTQSIKNIQQLSAAQKELEDSLDSADFGSAEFEKLSSQLKEVTAEFEELDKAAQLEEARLEISKTAKTVEDLKKQQEALNLLFENTDFGSQEYADLSKQLQEVNTRLVVIDESVSDITGADKVDGWVKFGSAIGGAFGTAAVAAQAFGASSEEIEKVQMKFGVLISTLETLKLVQEAVGKENKLFTSWMNRFASEADGSFKKAGIASKLFGSTTRLALAATGIGLFIIALTTIIVNFDKIKNKVLEVAKSFKPLNDAITWFTEKVGGLPQLFAGALNAATEFFVQIGKLGADAGNVIASIFTGGFTEAWEKLKKDASNFGGEISSAFYKGVEEKNAELAQIAANKQLQLMIDANKRALAVQQAYGDEAFALRKKILQQEYDLIVGQQKLLDKDSDEFAEKEKERLDKLSEFQVLKIEEQKARFEAYKKLLESFPDKLTPVFKINGFEVKTVDNAEEKLQKKIKEDIEKGLSGVKIQAVDVPLKPQIDGRTFFQKLNDQIEDFTGSAAFQKFADKFSSTLGTVTDSVSNVASGLTSLFQTQLDNINNQIDSITDAISLTDQQIDDSRSKQEDAEEKLKNASGARRQYLISQIEKEKKKETDLNNTRTKQAKEQEKLEKEAAKRKENLAKANKAIQIGQAISNTALAVIKFLADPGGIPGIALSVAAGITGALQIATIAAQKYALGGVLPSLFSTGGRLSGPSHGQGGIPFTVNGVSGFEAEGGETIINKRSSALFSDQLSAINSYNGWGVKFAAGGVVSSPTVQPAPVINNTLNNDALLDELRITRAEIVKINSTPVQLDVRQVTDQQARIAEIQNKGKL